jgi:hypothetical protein
MRYEQQHSLRDQCLKSPRTSRKSHARTHTRTHAGTAHTRTHKHIATCISIHVYNSTTGERDTESCPRLISQQSVTVVHAVQQLACAYNAGERRTSKSDPVGKRTVPRCKRDTGATLHGNTLVNSPEAAGDINRLPAQGNDGVRRASKSHGSSNLATLTHIKHIPSSPTSRQITPRTPPFQRTPSSSSKLRTCLLRTRSFVDLHRNGERMYAKAGGGGGPRSSGAPCNHSARQKVDQAIQRGCYREISLTLDSEPHESTQRQTPMDL